MSAFITSYDISSNTSDPNALSGQFQITDDVAATVDSLASGDGNVDNGTILDGNVPNYVFDGNAA